MAPKTTSSKLELSIRAAAQRFADDLFEIIRSATFEELTALQDLDIGASLAEAVPAPKRRVKPAATPVRTATSTS